MASGLLLRVRKVRVRRQSLAMRAEAHRVSPPTLFLTALARAAGEGFGRDDTATAGAHSSHPRGRQQFFRVRAGVAEGRGRLAVEGSVTSTVQKLRWMNGGDMRRPYSVALCCVLFALATAVQPHPGEAEPPPFASTSAATEANGPGPHVTLKTNRSAFAEGQVHVLSAAVSTASPAMADGYVVLRIPDGRLFSLIGSGEFVPGIVPFASNVFVPAGVPFPMQALLIRPVPDLPRGSYTWFGALTVPGTLDLLGNLAQVEWRFLAGTDADHEVTLDNGYRISLVEVTDNADGTSTWRYRVEELPSAQDLSNWVLELPACATVLGAAPEPWELVHPDPNAQLNGIKWEAGAGFQAGEFVFTLSEQWAVGATRVAAKGPDVAFGTIAGPICERPLDLALDKVANVATASPGDVVTYTISLRNVGTTMAEALVLTDTIPLGTTFVENSLHVTAGFAQFRADGNLVFWQGDLAPGQLLTMTFSVVVQPGVAGGSIIRNTVFAGPEHASVDIVIEVP